MIQTQGLPTDTTRATLKVGGSLTSSLTTAINGNSQSGVTVENIQIDGGRPALGRLDGGALMEMGASGVNQTVQNVYAHDTRSWSTLHIIEGAVTNSTPACQGAKILNNTIGPAGTDSPSGTWADGISLACGNSTVQGNTVQDATDGGIVIFGAPGSSVKNNTIVAKTRTLLGGINLVDYAPMNGNYTGTTVTGNTINAQTAFIKVGIAMGPQVWGCGTGTNYGASVTGNTLQGAHMGYGYAVNGVRDWTVTGNTDNSTHVGTPNAGCGGTVSAPGRFQVQASTSSTLQPEFTSAQLTYVLGVAEHPPTGQVVSLRAHANGKYVTASGTTPLIAERFQRRRGAAVRRDRPGRRRDRAARPLQQPVRHRRERGRRTARRQPCGDRPVGDVRAHPQRRRQRQPAGEREQRLRDGGERRCGGADRQPHGHRAMGRVRPRPGLTLPGL